ncbi:MAG: metallophosphoesterase family protein [Candidatus Acidiferrales bacterium]
MRIAILSDIHGNRTAFEAVLADLQQISPDLILHGGDLAASGANPVEIVDRIRDFGWQGVVGNTDEMLFRPESLEEFANQSSAPPSVWTAIRQMAAATRTILGEERIAWLEGLARVQLQGPMALVHASPESLWRAPTAEASDAELESVYGPLGQLIAVYAHIHRPYIRSVPSPQIRARLVANTGSLSLSYDGDPRASYLLLDGPNPRIRRVEYDIERELKNLATSGLPHADWIAKSLRTASPQIP